MNRIQKTLSVSLLIHVALFITVVYTFSWGSDFQIMMLSVFWCIASVFALFQFRKAIQVQNTKTFLIKLGGIVLNFMTVLSFSLGGFLIFIMVAFSGVNFR